MALKQDRFTMVKYLPRSAAEIKTIIFIKRTANKTKLLRVRRLVVEQLLAVIETHNPGVSSLLQNPTFLSNKAKRLGLLPMDGQLEGIETKQIKSDFPVRAQGPITDVSDNNSPSDSDLLSRSFLPIPDSPDDEKRCFRLFITKGEACVDTPSLDSKGVNEFKQP